MGKMVSEDGAQKGRKKERSDSNDRRRVEFKGYVSPTLSTAEKRAYSKWQADAAEVERCVSVCAEDGYKVSFDYMEREGAYRATLYCQEANSPNAGYCMSLFAATWWEAVKRVVYCHAVVLRADWTSLTGKGKWKDDWVE